MGILPLVLKGLGFLAARSLGAVTRPLLGGLLKALGWGAAAKVIDHVAFGDKGTEVLEGALDVASGKSSMLEKIFNFFAGQTKENGLYASVPVAAAYGAITGEGIVGRLTSAFTMAAVAEIATAVAGHYGIRMPGFDLKAVFGMADKPAEKPVASLPAPATSLSLPAAAPS